MPAAEPAAALADLVRVRCATDGRDVFVVWRGRVEAHEAEAEPRHLFDVVGVNVARCDRAGAGWYLTSRELMLYLDPSSGEVLDRWSNPWTGAEVPVVHVANDPVQSPLTRAPTLRVEGALATFAVRFPLRYPNPLAGDPRFAAYSPAPMYEASESFELSFPADELGADARAQVSSMGVVWRREGPWLPWMAMGDRPGRLVYEATGERVADYAAVPAALRAVIEERLPGYRAAPRCYLAADNMTSWRYFAAHFAAYLRGEQFPVSAPAGDGPCAKPAIDED